MDNIASNVTRNIEKLMAASQNEPVTSFFKFKLVDVSEGFAKVSLVVRPEFVNFNGLVFGGIIMALADQAFAYSTNSVISPNIASQFNIHLMNTSKIGDVLVACCKVIKSGKRVCVSEIEVLNQNGILIAKATGTTIPKIDELVQID